ncbi:TetR/AcrR family transcriptional regulator [Parvularcula sp. LCG005]|uniref:TetR/AcrR family transcriptional regulator n=1 Tax=Parvularcula sp. LCG005 TaxID=3078805 RepID=UPI00294233E5|nr:WHG domain-containing protein [Parvularcula sp. LCG005]WOI53678.1 WHG domain-containing protein [Parvularcula sp. LCG005]
MAKSQNYHHGDLRNAIINAAIAILDEKGVEGLTLRQCALRAGVSHGAPSHHFGDMRGLTTALAARGFAMLTEEMTISGDVDMPAIGIAYVRFALANPGLYSVMFRADLLNPNDADLKASGGEAYGVLAAAVARQYPSDEAEEAAMRDAMWSLVHGYASLVMAGEIDMPDDVERAVISLVRALT